MPYLFLQFLVLFPKSPHLSAMMLQHCTEDHLFCWVRISATSGYSILEYSTIFNPQNSRSAQLEFEKTWKTPDTWPKTRNTQVKFKLNTCSNMTVWNLMKLELDKKWARSGTSKNYFGKVNDNCFIVRLRNSYA